MSLTRLSDSDIWDVAGKAELKHSDLERLFVALGLKAHDIENAKFSAAINDYQLQAQSVLQFWRQINGSRASRQAIINALKECKRTKALEILIRIWNLETEGI